MEKLKFDDNMNYFVISDLHGQGKIYNHIVDNLDKQAVEKGQPITLIINGDIIDRGPDSIEMLVDVMERAKGMKGNINVIMLPGNHEEMMYSSLKYFKEHRDWDRSKTLTHSNVWFNPANHGTETAEHFFELPPEKQVEVYNFLKDLPLYCVVETTKPNYNSYVIVHACPPRNAMSCNYIPTLDDIVSKSQLQVLRECLTYRKNDNSNVNVSLPDKGVITLIGHTPVNSENGFCLTENKKLLMIDGGCAFMAANPDAHIMIKEMATLVKLSDKPGETKVGLYGDEKSKYMRQGNRK